MMPLQPCTSGQQAVQGHGPPQIPTLHAKLVVSILLILLVLIQALWHATLRKLAPEGRHLLRAQRRLLFILLLMIMLCGKHVMSGAKLKLCDCIAPTPTPTHSCQIWSPHHSWGNMLHELP